MVGSKRTPASMDGLETDHNKIIRGGPSWDNSAHQQVGAIISPQVVPPYVEYVQQPQFSTIGIPTARATQLVQVRISPRIYLRKQRPCEVVLLIDRLHILAVRSLARGQGAGHSATVACMSARRIRGTRPPAFGHVIVRATIGSWYCSSHGYDVARLPL